MAEHLDTDVAIIGAGPAGLFAVFELGMLQLSSVLIDALAETGGQCAALYPEKPIYDIPARPNRPPIPGLAAYEATGAVQYYVRRREDYRGQRVVIAGGGDSAVDWALALRDITGVTVVHRRAKFRAAPDNAVERRITSRGVEKAACERRLSDPERPL